MNLRSENECYVKDPNGRPCCKEQLGRWCYDAHNSNYMKLCPIKKVYDYPQEDDGETEGYIQP